MSSQAGSVICDMDIYEDFLDVDLSLFSDPDRESSFDWELALSDTTNFVDSLMAYNVMLLENNEPDIKIIQIDYDVEISMLIQQQFSNEAFQTIITNNHTNSKAECPYFRVVMKDFGGDSTINFKLRTFFDKIGCGAMNARCSKALVIGLHALHMLNSPINIPHCFSTTSIPDASFWIGGELDMACLEAPGKKIQQGHSLGEIAGMVLPYYLPHEIQMKILSFCRHPFAEMIDAEIDRVCHHWDVALTPMFMQREPRIPPNIASHFHASTVTVTISAATSPYLAPVASLSL